MQDLSWAIREATRSTYVLCCPTQLLEEPLMATRRYNAQTPEGPGPLEIVFLVDRGLLVKEGEERSYRYYTPSRFD
jgi:hypothetical protein